MRKKEIILIISIVVVVIAIGALIFSDTKGKTNIPNSEGVAKQNSISISNQLPGKTINIDSVELLNGGYLVVHKNQLDFPVEILGRSEYVEPGVYTNFPVSLTTKSKKEDKMFVVIHEDNGDKVFSSEDDYSALDENRDLIMSGFTIE